VEVGNLAPSFSFSLAHTQLLFTMGTGIICVHKTAWAWR